MATAEWQVTVHPSGPIFEGRAPAIIDDFMRKATLRLAETARDWIRIDAEGMDRSGRGGTGRAAAGVQLENRGLDHVVSGGIREGEYAWPWLEGTSKRNTSTRFKGYHTFRNAKNRLEDHVTQIIQPLVDDMVRELGGS